MIIGITGGTGCGKTTALQVFQQMGGTVLDCDAIYHRLLQTDNSLIQAISARFPGTVKDNILDRKALGNIVFSDKNALSDLNSITRKAVFDAVYTTIQNGGGHFAIDAIRLFESGLANLCDVTVAITAPEETRVQRLMMREGISREYAQKRIDAQPSQAEFSALCQHTLHNDGLREDFQEKCLAFFQKLGI